MTTQLEAVVNGQQALEGVWRAEVKRQNDGLADFAVDEDLAKALDAWLTKRKYHKLLELWVKGLAFDWNRLYGAIKPHRISLPTYPFAQQRYWVPDVQRKPGAERKVFKDRFDASFYSRLFEGLLDESVSIESAVRQAKSVTTS